MRGRDIVKQYIASNFEELVNTTVVDSCKAFARAAGHSQNFLDSIKFVRTGPMKGKVILDLMGEKGEPIGIFIEKGTKAHKIEGNPILHWIDEGGTSSQPFSQFSKLDIGDFSPGKDRFATSVWHPGTEGQHIMEKGDKFGTPRLADKVIEQTNEYLRGLSKSQ